jgi:hypothetical protein
MDERSKWLVGQYRVVSTRQVGTRAGPWPFPCIATQTRADRIQFDIADGGNQVKFIHDERMKTLLPQVPTPVVRVVYAPGVTSVSLPQEFGEAAFLGRHKNHMYVIGHQTVCPNADI